MRCPKFVADTPNIVPETLNRFNRDTANSAMASFKLLFGVLVTMAATGTMVTATPAAVKDTKEFCSFVVGDGKTKIPEIPICLKKLGIKTENPDNLLKSEDDKCLAKCILMELKEINENGEPDMATIETHIKAQVPSQYQKEVLSNTKSCLESSAEILKKAGNDKNVAGCKFAASLVKCHVQKHAKMCGATGA